MMNGSFTRLLVDIGYGVAVAWTIVSEVSACESTKAGLKQVEMRPSGEAA